jgi:hypothetical protein
MGGMNELVEDAHQPSQTDFLAIAVFQASIRRQLIVRPPELRAGRCSGIRFRSECAIVDPVQDLLRTTREAQAAGNIDAASRLR